MRFSAPSFFIIPTGLDSGPLTNGLKYFRIWLSFRRDIQSLVSKKLTPRRFILRGDSEKFEYLGEDET